MTLSRRTLLAALVTIPAQTFASVCSGAIAPAGRLLADFLDRSGVDHLWLPLVGTKSDGSKTTVLGADILELVEDRIQRKNSLRKAVAEP